MDNTFRNFSISISDRIAILISLLAVLASVIVAVRIYENIPHLEDEMAYVWQAQAITRGQLSVPSPPEPKSFLVPFVVDFQGQRFGKYPLGWPVLLSLGVAVGLRFLVNPLLAGFGVWLTYRLGKQVFGETVGLLAAGLTLTSPFFLMVSGSLLSHPLGLVLSTVFVMAWLEGFANPSRIARWMPIVTAAASLGLLILARPFSAIAIALPFGIHGIYLFLSGDKSIRIRLAGFGIIVLGLASIHFLWQFAVTGDPLLNPYTLWWSYDKVGFGPGHGRIEVGHTLHQAWINTRHSLRVGYSDLFGWGTFSWIFLPIGILAIWRNWRGILISLVFPSLVVFYLAYWIGSSLFGPRYFYEGLYSLTLTSAAGIAFLAGWPVEPGTAFPRFSGWGKFRPLFITACVSLLVCANLLFYTPLRLKGMFGLYGIQRSRLEPFQTEAAQNLTPALVFVHLSGKWVQYGSLLELQDPFLDTPFILAVSRGEAIDQKLAQLFPDRNIWHYYPSEPYKFYSFPKDY